MMKEDKIWCMSAYLMYRNLPKSGYTFCKQCSPSFSQDVQGRVKIKNAQELLDYISSRMKQVTKDGKATLALSGGIDSAILAKFMPPGSKVYTFKCVVPGVQVIDETKQARKYAELCGLNHQIVEVYWEDVRDMSVPLMMRKGSPIHSIETQIYKAACQAKQDGYEKFIFGENADIIYGGMNGLLAKDWTFGEFVDRYSYVMPYKVLRDYDMVLEPFEEFEDNGMIDAYGFINKYFRLEALGTYNNACDEAGIKFIGPFSETMLDGQLDYSRIRGGESKYIVREAFSMLYPELELPEKIPMPRPVGEWLKDWDGPRRKEFHPMCAKGMSGDQKWMLYSLEKFLDLMCL